MPGKVQPPRKDKDNFKKHVWRPFFFLSFFSFYNRWVIFKKNHLISKNVSLTKKTGKRLPLKKEAGGDAKHVFIS